jgi:hypothetical protein
MLNDTISVSGEAMWGQGIAMGGAENSVQLWNPWGSGRTLYLDRVVVACLGAGVFGDLRRNRSPVGSVFPDHVFNKVIDHPNVPRAEVRCSTAPVQDYEYSRPGHEFWVGGSSNDRSYVLDPPLVIPQGRGVSAAMSGTTIASFQWREKVADPIVDPGTLPPPPPPPGLLPSSYGTAIASLSNPQSAFDGSDATFSSGADASHCWIGKAWGDPLAISRFIIKSPVNRSFCGAEPPRAITWHLDGSQDGTTWVTIDTGTTTDATGAAQKTIDHTTAAIGVQYRSHRVRLVNPNLAGWRIGELQIYGV